MDKIIDKIIDKAVNNIINNNINNSKEMYKLHIIYSKEVKLYSSNINFLNNVYHEF